MKIWQWRTSKNIIHATIKQEQMFLRGGGGQCDGEEKVNKERR